MKNIFFLIVLIKAVIVLTDAQTDYIGKIQIIEKLKRNSTKLQVKGCYKDTNIRDLNGLYMEFNGTIQDCISFCNTNYFKYAGVQNRYLKNYKRN